MTSDCGPGTDSDGRGLHHKPDVLAEHSTRQHLDCCMLCCMIMFCSKQMRRCPRVCCLINLCSGRMASIPCVPRPSDPVSISRSGPAVRLLFPKSDDKSQPISQVDRTFPHFERSFSTCHRRYV